MIKHILKVMLMIRPALHMYVCMPGCVHTWCPMILWSERTEIWAPLCNMSQMSAMTSYLQCNMIGLLSFAMALKQKVISRHLKCILLNTDWSLATLPQRACHGQNTAECHLKKITGAMLNKNKIPKLLLRLRMAYIT